MKPSRVRQVHSKAGLAKWLFLMLPAKQRISVSTFLDEEERVALAESPVQTPQNESRVRMLSLELRKLRTAPNPLPLLWGASMMALAFASFVVENASPIMTYALYAVVGFLILSSRGRFYWKFLLVPSKNVRIFTRHIFVSFLFFLLIYTLTSLPNMYEIEKAGPELILRAGFVAPIFEELLFREYLFAMRFREQLLEKPVRLYGGMIFSSVFFAMVHFTSVEDINADIFAVTFCCGILLCLLRLFSGKLIWPILVHAASNVTHLTM